MAADVTGRSLRLPPIRTCAADEGVDISEVHPYLLGVQRKVLRKVVTRLLEHAGKRSAKAAAAAGLPQPGSLSARGRGRQW